MQINSTKKIIFFSSLINLIFFEAFVFSCLDRTIFGIFMSRDYVWQLIILNVIIQSSLIFYIAAIKKIKRDSYFRFILPVLLNVALIGFLFFSPIFILNQIVVLVSVLFMGLMILNIVGDSRFVFTNAASFFTIFLFFFDAYSLFFVLSAPYWAVMILVAIFSMLILGYKLKHLDIKQEYINLFIALFSIIISELFLFSFFWPINSIFIKSIILLFFYYLYWGFADIYVGNRFNLKNTLKYTLLFLLLLGLSIVSLFFNLNK